MSRRPFALVMLMLLLPLSAALAIGVGSSSVGWSDIPELWSEGADSATRQILLDVRLPRVLLAALVGAALAAAGGAFQGVLRNPLADPFILGVSGGSALGAVLFGALISSAGFGAFGRPLAGFAGAAVTLALLFRFARLGGRTGATTLLLVGVVINAIASALILFVITAGDPARFQSEFFFLVGRIPPLSFATLSGLTVWLVLGAGVLLSQAHRLNLLAMGEETATQLGVGTERTLWSIVIAASALTAAAVAFTGLVGFVGLIVPHTIRTLIGPDHRWLLPASLLGGASFLILADAAARVVAAPVEVPVGVITTLIGGPFFLSLFLRRLRAEGIGW